MRVSPTLVLAVLASLVIASCGSDSSREADLENRIAELEQQLERSPAAPTSTPTFAFTTSTTPTTVSAGLTDAEDVWCNGQGIIYVIAAGETLDLDSFAMFDSGDLMEATRALETGSLPSAETLASLREAAEGVSISTTDFDRACKAAYEAFS